MSFGLGFTSSILVSLYTIFLFIFMNLLQQSYYSQLSTVISLFVALISGIMYIVLIFGPALFVGWKKGIWWGVGTLGITLLLLCIYVGFFLLYLFVNNQRMYPGPIYLDTFSSPAVESSYMK